jgi:uncharacterized OB-fold protein
VNGTRLVAEGLLRLDGETRLLAGRRKSDGRLVFPLPLGGHAVRYDTIELGRRGRLWSWTVQRFAPKEPYDGPVGADFRPFAVGYVEIPGEIIVESRLVRVAFDQLRVGLPLQLTSEVYRVDPDGTRVLTYAFEPSEIDID